MCEGKPGVIHCDQCESARCESCDKRWHSHPKRKTHQTRRLEQQVEDSVGAVTIEVPTKSLKKISCFICGQKDIQTHCRTCSDFFCEGCDQKYHQRPDRSNHDRVPVPLVTRPPVPEPVNTDVKKTSAPQATYTERGARPKMPSGDALTNKETPREEQVRHKTPSPGLSETQILQNKLDELIAKDVQILEKLHDLQMRAQNTQKADIEGQIIQEEKFLRHQRQALMDEMENIEFKLSNLVHREKREVHQEREPVNKDHREPIPRQDQVFNAARPENPNIQQALPGNPVTVQKWKCEHCTFSNDASEGNICAVCSKTTANPQMVKQAGEVPEHHEEMISRGPPQPFETPLRDPPQATQRPLRGPPQATEGPARDHPQVNERPTRGYPQPMERPVRDHPPAVARQQEPIYEYESKEAGEMRLAREQEKENKEREEQKRQQDQDNLTVRLLLMYRHDNNFDANGEERFSLEEVATAWNVVGRDNEMTHPVEWLGKHLKHQLKLIGGDITKEFCRIYKLNPKKNHRLIPEDKIYNAWLKNDGMRMPTATECVNLLQTKVEEFCDKRRDIEKEKAAELLLQNGFDLDNMNWQLQRQAAVKDAEAIHEWLNQMWDDSFSIEGALEQIEKSNLNDEQKKEKIRRILMAEKGLIWAAVDTFFILRYKDERESSDCLEALKSSQGDLRRAKEFFKECSICLGEFVMSKLIGNPSCQCHVCTECFTQHFSLLAQSTPCMYKFVCPACNQPDLENSSDDEFHNYFALLGAVLHQHLNSADYNLYQQKLFTWGLIKDNTFRWCASGCTNGFINDRVGVKKIQCTNCKQYQCFDCKKLWLDQHDDISCEEFDTWKKNNDPEFQANGLAAHLKENGINCPRCKMRYELAKGGCMHFKCSQCMHEFCCGCNMAFLKYPNCRKYQSCERKGLHAHHPRDCLYHLRDENSEALQKLLQDHGVDFNQVDAAANLPEGGCCPVKEQQEQLGGLEDVNCGRPLKDDTGLCETHYKEYLVSLINQNKIDPADMFTAEELGTALGRDELQVPLQLVGETDEAYQTRLRQLLKEEIPLQVHGGEEAMAANRV